MARIHGLDVSVYPRATENIKREYERSVRENEDNRIKIPQIKRSAGKQDASFNANLASNGKPSNLTPEQYKQVRTPAFKKWFGDWEVLNAYNYAINSKLVVTITGNEFQKDDIPLTDKVTNWYKNNYNSVVTHHELGEVKLDLESAKDSLGHGIGRIKTAAFAAVPDIIENGVIFSREGNWKNRGYDTYVMVAPIMIGNEEYIGEVVVKRGTTRQGMYLHEVEITKKLEDVFKTANGSTPSRFRLIIAQHVNKVKDCSKVVDENGEPLVVYHGIATDNLTEFSHRKAHTEHQAELDSLPTVPYKKLSVGQKLLYDFCDNMGVQLHFVKGGEMGDNSCKSRLQKTGIQVKIRHRRLSKSLKTYLRA